MAGHGARWALDASATGRLPVDLSPRLLRALHPVHARGLDHGLRVGGPARVGRRRVEEDVAAAARAR